MPVFSRAEKLKDRLTVDREGWNRNVMHSVMLGCHANVRAFLASDGVAQLRQHYCQICSGQIAGQFHEASTSSRTK